MPSFEDPIPLCSFLPPYQQILTRQNKNSNYYRFSEGSEGIERKRKQIHFTLVRPGRGMYCNGSCDPGSLIWRFCCAILLLGGKLLITAVNEKNKWKTENWVKWFTSRKHKSYQVDYIKSERQKQHLCNPERQRMIFFTPTTEIPQSKFWDLWCIPHSYFVIRHAAIRS